MLQIKFLQQTNCSTLPTNTSVFILLLHYIQRKVNFSCFSANATPKEEVKACYQCKGAEACQPSNLAGAEIRTSAVLGAKNLYCFTVCREKRCFLSEVNSHYLFYL
jgi:hypothetical protein